MQLQEGIQIKGECRGFQTYLEYEPNKAGILMPIDTKQKVPGTDTGWVKNTIQAGLTQYLAYKLGTNTTNRALDSLFAADGAIGGGDDGDDGIHNGESLGGGPAGYKLATTLNDGGTEAESYIEFYGYIDGAVTLEYLTLGHDYLHASEVFNTVFAGIAVNQTVAASRRYGHYWKITLA